MDLRQRRVLVDRHVARIEMHPNTVKRVFEPESVRIVWRVAAAA